MHVHVCRRKEFRYNTYHTIPQNTSQHSHTPILNVMSIVAEGNVGWALGLVCIAGAATAIGAAVVFFPSIVKLASRRILAASLGFSAGVMTYVAFVKIFFQAVNAFGPDKAGFDDTKAFNFATLTFFCGVVLMKVRVTPSSQSFFSRIQVLLWVKFLTVFYFCSLQAG